MPVKLKRDQQLLIGVAVASVAFLWVYYAFLIQPLLKTASRVGQEIRSARVSVQHIEQAIAQLPRLTQEHETLAASMETLHAAMPTEAALPSVIEQLSALANQAGLRIQTIFPQRTVEATTSGASQTPAATLQATLYKAIPIQIDAVSGFHQLGAFLSRVEAGEQPIELKSLRISSSTKEPRRHTIKMVMTAYFASPDHASRTAGGAVSQAGGS